MNMYKGQPIRVKGYILNITFDEILTLYRFALINLIYRIFFLDILDNTKLMEHLTCYSNDDIIKTYLF